MEYCPTAVTRHFREREGSNILIVTQRYSHFVNFTTYLLIFLNENSIKKLIDM